MIFLFLLSSILTVGYLVLLGVYAFWWKPYRSKIVSERHSPFCSVIIAARNEEARIARCLNSVTTQSYPQHRYEVIVVNDGSEDDTEKQIGLFPFVRLLQTSGEFRGKKHALTIGIAIATGELILTTDADCTVHPRWIQSVVDSFRDNTHMVTGPVLMHHPQNALQRFQALDLIALTMTTASGMEFGMHHLANGANMAFRKATFDAAGGFSGNAEYASGDDIFLVQAIGHLYPGSIKYMWDRDAIVYTEPGETLHTFIHQRLRWATKNKSLQEKSVFWIWFFIWSTFATVLTTLLMSLFHGLYFFISVLGLILMIAIAEYKFLRTGIRYFGQSGLLKGFAISFLLHFLYVIFIGLASMLTKRYWWKGRKVR